MNELASRRVIYEHRQVGWMILMGAWVPLLCLAVIWTFTPIAQRELPPHLLPGLAIASALAIVSFSSMSVVVTGTRVVARFGLGLLKRTAAVKHIVSVTMVRTRWYEGWGIHWTSRGMLYNVSGSDAVRLELDNGKAFMIGSDEARRLCAAIERAMQDSRERTRHDALRR